MERGAFDEPGHVHGHRHDLQPLRRCHHEITTISGVEKVDIEVEAGRVTVFSDSPLSAEDVRAALTEAGDYELVGA